MNIKLLEIRDRCTLIPVMCIDMNLPHTSEQYHLMRYCGFPLDMRPNIVMTELRASGGEAWNDPYGWSSRRTMPNAHQFIIDHWNEIEDGDVIDVEFILGETDTKKVSEIQR